jgi:hypothetical protein
MSNPSETQTPNPENLRSAYQALCTSYNAIDTFRGQLLGFLPLASGSIFALFNIKEVKSELISLIGLFGFLITCGLFIFEIYGIRRCTHLIVLGQHLEEEMEVQGQFRNRPRGLQGLPEEKKYGVPGKFLALISEPMAAGIVYPTVCSAWLYLSLNGIPKASPSVPESTITQSSPLPMIFLVATIFASLGFNWWLTHCDAPKKKRQLDCLKTTPRKSPKTQIETGFTS